MLCKIPMCPVFRGSAVDYPAINFMPNVSFIQRFCWGYPAINFMPDVSRFCCRSIQPYLARSYFSTPVVNDTSTAVDCGFHHGPIPCGLLGKRWAGGQTAETGADALKTPEDFWRSVLQVNLDPIAQFSCFMQSIMLESSLPTRWQLILEVGFKGRDWHRSRISSSCFSFI